MPRLLQPTKYLKHWVIHGDPDLFTMHKCHVFTHPFTGTWNLQPAVQSDELDAFIKFVQPTREDNHRLPCPLGIQHQIQSSLDSHMDELETLPEKNMVLLNSEENTLDDRM